MRCKVLWSYSCFIFSVDNRNNDKFDVKKFSSNSKSYLITKSPIYTHTIKVVDEWKIQVPLGSFGFASKYEYICAVNASGKRWKPNYLKIRQMELNWQFPSRHHEVSQMIYSSLVHQIDLLVVYHFSESFLKFFPVFFLYIVFDSRRTWTTENQLETFWLLSRSLKSTLHIQYLPLFQFLQCKRAVF